MMKSLAQLANPIIAGASNEVSGKHSATADLA